IRALQKIDLNILEVAEIFESRQIIDTDTGLRHPIRITINNADEVEFPNKVYEFERIMVFLLTQEILPV
ncbi:MAG: hypothetical protein RTU92_04650, partial [Candidatus Thorarchaeota archaeon]